MRKITSLLVVLFSALVVFSQKTELTKRPTLGINFFLKDYVTPDLIGKSGLPVVLRDGTWNKVSNMTPGMSVSYFQGLSDHVDFMANLHGDFINYPFYNGTKVGTDKFQLESDANVNLKLLTDKYFLVPYLSGGVGLGMVGGTYFYAYIPVGTGLQFSLGEGSFINLQWSYHLRVSDYSNYNFHYSLGFSSPLTEKKAAPVLAPTPPPPPPVVVDTDKDGIPDDQDKCPTVPGVAKYQGCPVPDTDGDGINDDNDKCPTVPGVAKYQGCPIPDTDKDGINDEEDKCPTVPGVARYQGCPVPDRDGDGVNDEEDRCPDTPGKPENHGCPVVEYVPQHIKFASSKAVLTKEGIKELDEKVIPYLQKNSLTKFEIGGHTDASGNDKINKPLSEKRAQTVKDYIVKKGGIDPNRLIVAGYGSSQPLDTNKTAAGKAMNRRVEFKMID